MFGVSHLIHRVMYAAYHGPLDFSGPGLHFEKRRSEKIPALRDRVLIPAATVSFSALTQLVGWQSVSRR